MTDKDNQPKKRFGRIKKFARLGIRIPSLDKDTKGLSVRGEWAELRKNLQPDQMLCPDCNIPLKLHDVFQSDGTDETGMKLIDGPVTRALSCECGYILPIEPIIQDAKAELKNIKSAEKQFMGYGLLIIFLFVGISYLNGSMATLLGGLIFGLVCIIRGVIFRYKYWQISHNRLFEDNAPIADWLRHEWSN